VTWNEGSRRHYEKLYFKADELGPHVSQEVRDYCNENGVLRYEVSLKARELADRGLKSIRAWARTEGGLRMDNVVFGRFAQVLTRNQVTVTEIQDIPGKLGLVARLLPERRKPLPMGKIRDVNATMLLAFAQESSAVADFVGIIPDSVLEVRAALVKALARA